MALSLEAPADFPFDELAGPVLRPIGWSGAARDWRYLVPDGEGLLLRGDGSGFGWRDRLLFNDLRVTLPMTALLDPAGATLLVTAVDGQDHAVDLVAGVAGGSTPGLGLVHLPALGRWGYGREWRVVAAAVGGVVGLADSMRNELQRNGIQLSTRGAAARARAGRVSRFERWAAEIKNPSGQERCWTDYRH